MVTKTIKRGLPAMHPGEPLARGCHPDVIPAIGRPKAEIASLLGISRQTFQDILAEKQPVTTATAMRLGKLVGNGPRFWLSLQLTYDVERVGHDVDVSAIPTLKAA